MRRFLPVLLAIHIILVLLGSTRFTLVTVLWGKHAWTFNYYTYSFISMWGQRYVSQ